MAREILLNTGNVAIVDDEDYELVSRYNWTEMSNGYASASIKINGKWKTVCMHRLINKTPAGMHTDHIDGDRLNNRRENLRTCNRSENNRNVKIRCNNTSGFKGVTLKNNRNSKSWYARVQGQKNGKQFSYAEKCFPFTDEGKLQAARWYDEQARLHFGEFAKVNGV